MRYIVMDFFLIWIDNDKSLMQYPVNLQLI